MSEPRKEEKQDARADGPDQEPLAAQVQAESGDQDLDTDPADGSAPDETVTDVSEESEPELSPEEILRGERDSFQEKWLRVVAELDNVRKRSRREVADTRRHSQADILRSFLDVQDNFVRAFDSLAGNQENDEEGSFRKGVELIFQSFQGVMKDRGVEAIEALEQEFDPTVHEAVGQLAREGVEPGIVIEVVQEGFRLGDLVLRPARVIVSS